MSPNINPKWAIWQEATGGGRAWQFMLWCQEQWAAFEKERGLRHDRAYRYLYHADFNKWLSDQFKRREAA